MKQLNKKGLSLGVNQWIAIIIGIVVLFNVLASLFPTLQSSGETLDNGGFPLGSLFNDTGAIWYLLSAAVIYLLIRSFGGSKK